MDEQVKRLRELQFLTEHCSEHPCFECENRELCDKNDNKTLSGTYKEAADAIEFLQTYKVAFENIISMGGWWLVGQDKNLHRMNVPMNWPPKGTKTVELFTLPEPPKEET